MVLGLVMSSCGGGEGDDTSSAALVDPTQSVAETTSARPTTSRPRPSTTRPPAPVITTEEVAVTEAIPFGRSTREDSSMAAGVTAITSAGVPGVRTLTYRVTLTDGVETARELIADVVTTAPVDEVTSIGTYVAPPPPPPPADDGGGDCDPNYSGCVPIASDVDCAGGSGNGPAYVDGPVRVLGSDIYDLDHDGDGIGCES